MPAAHALGAEMGAVVLPLMPTVTILAPSFGASPGLEGPPSSACATPSAELAPAAPNIVAATDNATKKPAATFQDGNPPSRSHGRNLQETRHVKIDGRIANVLSLTVARALSRDAENAPRRLEAADSRSVIDVGDAIVPEYPLPSDVGNGRMTLTRRHLFGSE